MRSQIMCTESGEVQLSLPTRVYSYNRPSFYMLIVQLISYNVLLILSSS
jgi:hypothetical protein